MSAFRDIIGEVFDRLTVIGPYKRSGGMTYWNCTCSCGSEPKYVSLSALRGGQTRSCGCLHKEVASYTTKKRFTKHGKFGSKIYSCWSAMIERCNNTNNTQYHYYGGRGIKVNVSWRKFENFYSDMGDVPPGMTLDRIDNNGDYCKNNCRWVTMREQCNNRRNSIYVEYQGNVRTLSSWSREPWVESLGLGYDILLQRWRRGERGDKLFLPKHPRISRQSL